MRRLRKYLVREDGTFHRATDNLPMYGYIFLYQMAQLQIFLLDNIED